MARSSLWHETIATLRAYLTGKLTREEAAAWAVRIVAQETFLSDELILEQAVLTLLELQDSNLPFATARSDLEHLLNCLMGTQSLQLELHYSPQTLKVKE